MDYNYETLRKISKTKKAKEYIAQVEKYYQEHYAKKPILTLPFFDFKRYRLDGDRITYENAYFERRNRLFLLQVLAVAKDKYVSALEDILAAICDEFTWVVPAHTRFTIDLFAAETAGYLAETVYIFKDKLSEEIKTRIYKSLENKTVRAYEEQQYFEWEGYKNNWMAVCSCGIGLVYLYLFPERFENVKLRLFSAFEAFIKDGFDEDGYCSEGVTYWVYGFGFFCYFFDAYVRLYKERPAFIDCEKISKILRYFSQAHLQGKVYLPFADGGRRDSVMDAHNIAKIKSLYQEKFTIPETEVALEGTKALGLAYLFSLDDLKGCQQDGKETSFYYETAQVFIRKRKSYAFTVKGGNNNELHNHNDVGAFQIVKNGKRYICDVGACVYTREVFDVGRYNVFNCNSLSHSVPIIDGKLQSAGAEFYGKVLSVGKNTITIDMTNAYDNGAKELVATFETNEHDVALKYAYKGVREKIVFRFVSDLRPKIKDGVVWIVDMRISCGGNLIPKISKTTYNIWKTRQLSKRVTAYIIEYTVERVKNGEVKFAFEMRNNIKEDKNELYEIVKQ